jgi:hypothetical protein
VRAPAQLLVRRLALPAACAAQAAVVALLFSAAAPPGSDEPAHLFQTWLYEHAGFEVWNNYWYAGRYEFFNYSVLYYPLAAALGQQVVPIASVAALVAAFAALTRREWGRAAAAPSIAFAITAPLALMISGAYPFFAGAAFSAMALVALQRGRRGWFGVAVIGSLACSPLAFALLLPLLAGVVLAQPRPAEALRRHRVAVGIVVAVFLVGVLLQAAFPTDGHFPYSPAEAAVVTGFSLAGLWVAGRSSRARSLRMLFLVYLSLNLVVFLVPGPIGANGDRLFAIAGLPLLWLAANVGANQPRRVVMPLLAIAFAFQAGPFVRNAYSSWQDPAPDPAFWQPVVDFLEAHPTDEHRVEVVATRGHWEAWYLARLGVPIARGWYRQDDFPQNQALYRSDLTGIEYRRWLRSIGVEYVFLPDSDLDYSTRREAELLRTGRSGLDVVHEQGAWTVYRLAHAYPIVTPTPTPPPSDPDRDPTVLERPEGKSQLLDLDRQRVRFHVSEGGRYLVRVRFSPYWRVAPTYACAAPTPNGMTEVFTPVAGTVSLQIRPNLGDVAGTVAQRGGDCPALETPA